MYKKRISFICKCGLKNYTLEDWIAHWKWGEAVEVQRTKTPFHKPTYPAWMCKYPKIRAIYFFCLTKIEFTKIL